jgi:hypothetical protein
MVHVAVPIRRSGLLRAPGVDAAVGPEASAGSDDRDDGVAGAGPGRHRPHGGDVQRHATRFDACEVFPEPAAAHGGEITLYGEMAVARSRCTARSSGGSRSVASQSRRTPSRCSSRCLRCCSSRASFATPHLPCARRHPSSSCARSRTGRCIRRCV